MTRIPEADLEKLKQEISIQRLAESRGVILRKHGDELLGLCPFHDDQSPSLVINPIKNIWHCLGACQTGGSVIDWVMKAEGISFRHAVEVLRKDSFSLVAEEAASPQKIVRVSTVRKLDAVIESDIDEQRQLSQVIDYYHTTLKQSPEALEYLTKRGINSAEAIDTFRLGYSNRTLGYHIPQKNRDEGAEIRGALEKLGIIRSTGHELFRGSIVIPVINEEQCITEIYGRKIGDRLRAGTPLHLYLPGPHRGVWNIPALMASSEIILCESLIDALTFWCAGYRNVTASYGVEGFTEDHMNAFRQYGIERVLIAYDRDEAGDKAAAALSKTLMAEGIDCFRIQFPHNMDANEYALSVKPAEKSLGIAIRKAVWLGNGAAPGITSCAVPCESSGKATKGGNRNSEDQQIEPPDETVIDLLCINSPVLYNDNSTSVLPIISESKAELETSCSNEMLKEPTALSPLVAESQSLEPVASPLPKAILSEIPIEQKEGEVRIRLGDRLWRVRGLEKNMSFEQLRVNLLVSKESAFHVDTFDLYNARHRQTYLKQASEELELKEDVLKKDLGKVLLKLEELQERQIQQAFQSKDVKETMTEKERAAAMELLKSPDLLERILIDFKQCGIIGEETNKLTGYLAAVSRKLEEPLAIVIQSSSAAGKSSLMEAILSFMPSEEQVKYSAMTGQSLFYMGETDLQHKILAIAEEEGAERASYALKLLQSEGELTIASTGKDPATGRLVTQEYRVQGPVMIFLTTTAIEIDEELLNRCIVLTVDEDRDQTRAIHKLQRERQTLQGLLSRRDRDEILSLHQNAQRLLRPLLVANPYANELTFLDNQTRTRRDHMKYLTLIRAIALLHQHQRMIKKVSHRGKTVSYIEVELKDIETANRLAHEVLGRSLDELAPQTRRLLDLLYEMVTKRCHDLKMDQCDYRFTRRELCDYSKWSYDRVHIHLERLVTLEYVLTHHGGRGQRFVYELLYNGDIDHSGKHLMGLIDIESLQSITTTKSFEGKTREFGPPFEGHLRPICGGFEGTESAVRTNKINGETQKFGKNEKNAHLDERKSSESYIQDRTNKLAASGDANILSYCSEVQ
jgi:DNA primase